MAEEAGHGIATFTPGNHTMIDPMADHGAFWCYTHPREAADEIGRLRERLGPRGLEIVEINGAGHYVNEKVKAEIERLRKALSQIAWMDEFLSADAAREMMNIARDALSVVVGHKETGRG